MLFHNFFPGILGIRRGGKGLTQEFMIGNLLFCF